MVFFANARVWIDEQVIARLVDVAEQAQGEAAAAKIELDRLKQVRCSALVKPSVLW